MTFMTIITASYNCGRYLDTCINSVRKQSFIDYEHLILDDHSTDKTRRILKKHSKDPHVRILNPPKRLKCGSAYNYLSKNVKGDIVGVLDADDALTSKSIIQLIRLYDKYPDVDYIWTQFWLCDAQLRKIKRGFSSFPKKMGLLEAGIRGKHCFSHWRTFRKRILDKGDIFPIGLKSAVDKYMGYSMEEKGIGGFIDIPMYKYRQRVGGLSYTGRKNWKIMKKQFSERRVEGIAKAYPIKKLEM